MILFLEIMNFFFSEMDLRRHSRRKGAMRAQFGPSATASQRALSTVRTPSLSLTLSLSLSLSVILGSIKRWDVLELAACSLLLAYCSLLDITLTDCV